MYTPEIGMVYRTINTHNYFKIVGFENSDSERVTVRFQVPGADRVFECKGLDCVSSFLETIEPCRDLDLELQELASIGLDLDRQQEALRVKTAFLEKMAAKTQAATSERR